MGNPARTVALTASIPDPLEMANDNYRHRLVALNTTSNRMVTVSEKSTGGLDPRTTQVSDARSFGLKAPAGMAVDNLGDIYLLDATGPRLVRVRPQADGGFAQAAVSATDIGWLAGHDVRGLAYDPATGHLSVLSQQDHSLYEMTRGAEKVGVHDVSAVKLRRPQGMVFAPSADRTDASGETSLYVADAGATSSGTQFATSAQVMELSFAALAAPAGGQVTSSLLNTVTRRRSLPPARTPRASPMYRAATAW